MSLGEAGVKTGRFVAERRTTIAQQVYQYLRREIIDGRLVPRAPLSEQDLAQQLGVSRTPVREALIKLAEERLVDIYPQLGTFVAPIGLSEVYDSQFVREAIECAALSEAVERIDGPQIAGLRAILDDQRTHHRSGDLDAFFAADERMHAFLMDVGGHPAVWSIVENAKAQMDRVRHLIIRREIKLATVIDEHAAIVEAVAKRDRKAAIAALQAHLRGLFGSVDALMAENRGHFAEAGEGPPRRAARTRR
ncbi:MAG: GntR family transcriptional regulator [Rhodospirillales bacterium]|nr:GntR family transcriptional regulator [Rhodospirillales bacterium]